jgi:prepilin-type processing-associated H-X9-DG protein
MSAGHANSTAAGRNLAKFLCPSDSATTNLSMGTAKPGLCNYMGNLGWPPFSKGPQEAPRTAPANYNGFFGISNPTEPASWHVGAVRQALFTDGLSRTVAVVERNIVAMTDDAEIERARDVRTVAFCALGFNTIRSLEDYQSCISDRLFVDAMYSRSIGRAWISGWSPVASAYLHVLPLNQANCHLMGGEGNGGHLGSPSSRHGGGVHALMGDGRVDFFSDSLSLPVWWALGSRDGGETTSDGL